MVLLMFGLKIAFSPLIVAAGGGSTTAPVLKGGLPLVLISFAILPIETLIGQAFPIWALKKFGARKWPALCLLSALAFGLLHAPIGGGAFLVGFTSGLVLSYCWLSWRTKSLGMAFWSTTLVHGAHNALAFLVFMLGNAAR
jgi:membrane protease YdiL (CAAX protease family)